jgi:hypothetical protein
MMGSFVLDPGERQRRAIDGVETLKEQNKASIAEVYDLYQYYTGECPPKDVIAFELMVQFVERCLEDARDPTPFRQAAIHIACGCSVEGKSNAPTSGSKTWRV